MRRSTEPNHSHERQGKSIRGTVKFVSQGCARFTKILLSARYSSFFQNEQIFVEFNELDELDRITHA